MRSLIDRLTDWLLLGGLGPAVWTTQGLITIVTAESPPGPVGSSRNRPPPHRPPQTPPLLVRVRTTSAALSLNLVCHHGCCLVVVFVFTHNSVYKMLDHVVSVLRGLKWWSRAGPVTRQGGGVTGSIPAEDHPMSEEERMSQHFYTSSSLVSTSRGLVANKTLSTIIYIHTYICIQIFIYILYYYLYIFIHSYIYIYIYIIYIYKYLDT